MPAKYVGAGKSFASYIDLLKNELRNARIQNLSAAPASPVAGQIYWDTTLNVLRVYNGSTSSWQSIDLSGLTLDIKQTAKALQATNITVSNPGTATFDGYTASNGDRLLLTGQSSTSQNGIWVFNGSAAALTRPADFATGSAQSGVFIFIDGGATYANTGWAMTGTGTVTVDTTAQSWAQFTGTGDITVSLPLVKTGNNLSAPNVPTKYATSVGDGSSLTYAVTHNLNTLDVIVTVYDNGTLAEVECDIVHTSTTVVTVSFGQAATLNQYRVVVVG